MAARSFWKGYLKLSLVTCRVSMMPATTEGEKVHFHTLNRNTESRVVSQYVDSVTGKVIEEDDRVKGFERGEDDYVMLEDEELEAVELESARTIDIDSFVAKDDIEWIWYDKPHFLTPDDEVGEEPFAVIRDAMARSKVVGIAKLVMYRRERAVMLEPRENGIVLWTLRYGDEVRDPDDYFGSMTAEKSESQHMKMMEKFIAARSAPWDSSILEDPVQDRLLDIIKDKKKKASKKKKIEPAEQHHPRPKGENVVDLMAALKKSLKGR